MVWKIDVFGEKPDFTNKILITGLPGIGNVGKIVADFLLDELKAQKICEFSSYYMPHSVFITEDNMVELPKIELYVKDNFVILSGDSQPIDEIGCYTFCEALLDFVKGIMQIITLGGIGLSSIPKKPIVYCTGNNKEIIKKYSGMGVKTEIYGVVGPIVGVSGVLVGLAKKRNISAVSLLAETLGHPMYLGLKGAMEILKVLDKKFELKLNLENLNKEIKEMESKMKIAEELDKITRKTKDRDVSYIG